MVIKISHVPLSGMTGEILKPTAPVSSHAPQSQYCFYYANCELRRLWVINGRCLTRPDNERLHKIASDPTKLFYLESFHGQHCIGL